MTTQTKIEHEDLRGNGVEKDISYLFVIDTENYAGDFIRQMIDHILCINSLHDVECPVSCADRRETEDDELDWGEIYPTPGWFNNGMQGEFRDGDEELAQEEYVQANLEYAAEYKNEYVREHAHEPFKKYPCYFSVSIFLSEKPVKSELKLFKERAYEFAEENKINITGFRLIKQTRTIKKTSKEV